MRGAYFLGFGGRGSRKNSINVGSGKCEVRISLVWVVAAAEQTV